MGPDRGDDVANDMTGRQPIRVFVLDDHEVVRLGMSDLLEAEPDIHVVGDTGTAASAVAEIMALRPDVAILDVRLSGHSGVDVCREIHKRLPGVACLMLTAYDDDRALRDAILAGCAGYMLKQIRGTSLATAVRTVAAGHSVLDPYATSRLMAWMRDRYRRASVSVPIPGASRPGP